MKYHIKLKRRTSEGLAISASIIAFLMIGALTINVQAYDKKDIKDKAISQAIETDLLFDQSVPAHLIDVMTNDGIVTLSGSVDNLLAKDRALEISETVKGVRSVINRIDVKAIERSDSEIRSDVEDALLHDPAADSYEIKVSVKDGIVTLNGTVESWAEKQLARDVSKTVRGVKDVNNEILFDYETDRSDFEIANDVERRLETDPWVDATLINIEVKNGEVNLTGSVGSASEKTHAANTAWVTGAKAVDDSGLEVKWWMRDDMRREDKIAMKSDEEIKAAIEDAFLYDPRVFSFNPEVEVNAGEVILRGSVSNLRAKMAAEDDASNTIGVWRVLNFLKVRPGGIYPDSEIAKNIEQAFLQDVIVEPYKIDVNVRNGRVYLSGHVDSDFEKSHAEDLAARVRGVIVIDNNIVVDEPWEWKSDRAIAKDVKSELFWNPRLKGERIQVFVENGIVTLEGTIENWLEYRLATDEAYEGGALGVKNNLEIDPQT